MKFIFIFILAFILEACSGARAVETATIVRLNEKELSIQLVLGQSLTIKSSPAPISAFRWVLSRSDQQVMKEVHAPDFESIAENSLLGAEVRTRFYFSATKKGVSQLHFQWIAGRGNNITQRDEFFVNVTVEQ